jgi:diguanylate cyclase (GGDEF)-like protein
MFLSIALFALLYLLTLYFRRKYYDSYTDPLTKVYNRKYLYDIVLKKLSRSYQLFMVDIDFFKKVNDNYGHDTGDYVLKEVASRIESLIRDEDSLIRYGGEEFLIYTSTLSVEKSLDFAQRIRKKVKDEPIIYKGVVCHITVSIGINPYALKNESFDDMLIKADKALYEAKLLGRDCVEIAQ